MLRFIRDRSGDPTYRAEFEGVDLVLATITRTDERPGEVAWKVYGRIPPSTHGTLEAAKAYVRHHISRVVALAFFDTSR